MNRKQKIISSEEAFKLFDKWNSYNSRRKGAMKKMEKNSYNEHLDYILENTTPYQRMVWLGKAIAFWKTVQKQRQFRQRPATVKN